MELRAPVSPTEWERYFDLRWRILRAPWNQPRGSERDEREDTSIHIAVWDGDSRPVAVGRAQLNSDTESQVRYMAVEPDWSGRGFGSRVLAELEALAAKAGADLMILNAREAAQPFYRRHGYEVVAPADTLYGEIPHVRMEKRLKSL